MAKHSKGKHSQQNTVGKQDKKASKETEEESQSGSLGKHAGTSDKAEKNAQQAADIESAKSAKNNSNTENTAASDITSADQKTGDLSKVAEALKAEEEEEEASSPSHASAKDAKAEKATGATQTSQAGAKKSEGANSATGGFQPATITIEKKQRDKKKLAKRIGITTVSVVGALAAIYLAGVFVFSGRFYPNTHISNIDISWETPLEVQHEFEDKVGNYSFDVKGHGLNFSVTSEEAGLNIDSVAMTDTIKEGQDPWKWPIEIFEHRDMSAALTDALSATKLFDVVNAEVEQLNTTAKDPVNAYVTYNDKASAFVIEPEVQGTKLSAKAVLEDIVIGAMNLDPEVVIMEDDLLPPAVLHDDERLLGALDQANALIKADLDLMLSGTLAAEINAATIYPWVSVTPEFAAVLNTDAMNAYANELASNFNTIGKTRTYVRPDGKQVTVSGGDYGWAVNQEQLAASIAESIANGVVGAIDIPVKQTGKGFSGIGGKDWGARYIDVDISQQHARFYGDDGSIIWESNIITGKPSTPTPTGVYDINLKGRHVTLTGRDSAGNITYESPVSYWMPFKGNSVGFHDADWQSSFGGNRYRSGHGSHGCVNLPVSKAKELYSIIQTGDVVVVHG